MQSGAGFPRGSDVRLINAATRRVPIQAAHHASSTPVRRIRNPRLRLGAVVASASVVTTWHHLTTASSNALEGLNTRDERLERWFEGWKIGRTAFHKPEVNSTILVNEKTWLAKGSKEPKFRVLIPLAGKTVDMPYLASLESVEKVVGVEGVPMAVEQFMQENPALKMKRKYRTAHLENSGFQLYEGNKAQMYVGDFFEFDGSTTGQDQAFDRVWDRGSLVAIAPALRPRYVSVVDKLLVPGGKILLESLDRAAGPDAARKKGPPFSLTGDDVHRLFDSKQYTVQKLSSKNILKEAGYDRFKSEGLTVMNQEAWLITKKP